MRAHCFLPALLLLLTTAPALAQSGGIHRCIAADGHPVFTDRVCADLQATPAPPQASPGEAMPSPAAHAPPPILCAGSAAELKQAVIDAFAAHDANRLAGLILWNGYGEGAVVSDIRALASLMERPLLEVEEVAAETAEDENATPATGSSIDTVSPPPIAAPPSLLVLHSASSDGSGMPQDSTFKVIHRAGCLWLQPH